MVIIWKLIYQIKKITKTDVGWLLGLPDLFNFAIIFSRYGDAFWRKIKEVILIVLLIDMCRV